MTVTVSVPGRPTWVEGVNTIGRCLGGSEALISLDGDDMLRAATRHTGLTDFGGDGWRVGYEKLVAALTAEARLNTVGRLLARSEIVRVLQNRLRIVATVKAHPEIEDEAVREPIFITGTARSGTSILHELMDQDADNRTTQAWEVHYTTPPPETATYATDPRIEPADREVTLWHEIAPEYLAMHENGGRLPLECIFLMAHEFMSDHWSGVHDVPSYAIWLATEADIREAFRFHRKMLQVMQWRCRGARWMLKAPSHLHVLPQLFDVYPDARVILTHRDPVKTVPSSISLVSTLRRMRSDEVDVESIARQYSRGMRLGLEKVARERENGTLPDERFVDLHFAALMDDPVEAVGRVYTQMGLTLTEETARAIAAYVASRPRGHHGAHRYSLSEFGIDEGGLREHYRSYTDRYGVRPEA